MALPKQNRLGSIRDFSRVHRQGKRASTQHLAVRALYQLSIPLSDPSSGQRQSRQATKQPPVLRSAKRLKLVQPSQSITEPPITEPRRSADVHPVKVISESADGAPSALSSSFGISISRKVSKRAVVRNRIKRQLKAIIRRHLPDLASGWQVVIVVRPAAVECGFDDFLRELEGLLKKLKILN